LGTSAGLGTARQGRFGINYALNFRVMLLAPGILAAAFGAMVVVIFRGLQKAPEAYEDEHGFHLIRKRASGSGILRKKRASRPEAGSLKGARVNP
jgi:hypothetical protein